MNLIIGATGLLGSEICRHLTAQGEAVTALVRDTSGPEKVAQLKSLGAELVRGDLKDLPSFEGGMLRCENGRFNSIVHALTAGWRFHRYR